VPVGLGHGAEDVGGFVGDFRADAVAGEDCNFETHTIPLFDLLPLGPLQLPNMGRSGWNGWEQATTKALESDQSE
jgi:hypothetical protein